ncbi:MAG: hypothetical protein RSA99_01480 [Oscillospiraceae bacterium]
MNKDIENEIKEELQLAELMVKDLQRLWNSYAKKALIAKQERELKQEKKGFMECENIEELADAFGYGEMSEEIYYKGLEYFENADKPPKQSIVELHRKNIKKILDNWKGTVKMLNDELNPPEKKEEETVFEKIEREEREERYNAFVIGSYKNE